jgi:hypothetical protein
VVCKCVHPNVGHGKPCTLQPHIVCIVCIPTSSQVGYIRLIQGAQTIRRACHRASLIAHVIAQKPFFCNKRHTEHEARVEEQSAALSTCPGSSYCDICTQAAAASSYWGFT